MEKEEELIERLGKSKEDGNRKKSFSKFIEDKRKEKMARERKIEESWKRMKSCIDYIEENEDWLIQSKMERNHDEASRMEN